MKYISFLRHAMLRTRSRLLSQILTLTGLCGVLVLFEACYGTPQNFEPVGESQNMNFKGQVLSADSLKPVPGARVILTGTDYPNDSTIYTYTNASGGYELSIPYSKSYEYTLSAFDVDDTLNGNFLKTDTLTKVSSRDEVTGEHKSNILLKRKP